MRKILNTYVVLSSYLDIQKQIFISEWNKINKIIKLT
jgi:hypothetical protein